MKFLPFTALIQSFIIQPEVYSRSFPNLASRTVQEYQYQLPLAASEILNNFIPDFNFVNDVLNHGCWCAKLNPETNKAFLGGRTVIDELDEICKNWANARKCTQGIYGGEDLELNLNNSRAQHYYTTDEDSGLQYGICEFNGAGDVYEIDFTSSAGYSEDTKFCSDDDLCLKKTCEIDVWFLHEITQWKEQNPDFIVQESPVCEPSNSQRLQYSNCLDGRFLEMVKYDTLVECKPGFHMSEGACNMNLCSCEYGMAANGIDCPVVGEQVCINCNPGYELVGNVCQVPSLESLCAQTPIDFVFLVDGSSSVGQQDFDTQSQFLQELVDTEK